MAYGERKFGMGERLYHGVKGAMEAIGRHSSGMASQAGKRVRRRQIDIDRDVERATGLRTKAK